MPLKHSGDILVGEDARAKITQDIIAKSDLTPRELEFILLKLKDASYKGSEFEMFYSVFVKLKTSLDTLKAKSKGQ